MKRIAILKAQPTLRDTPVESVTIQIVDEFVARPGDASFATVLADYDEQFTREAIRLEKALRDALPGGTYDRLLGEMLKHKASHFVVLHK